ncbi:MAG TPA: hypothetical protein VMY06_07135 [Sedimentisphaerales bacterium]|nr:hypothetical protein [Sedimentisphaerales bacterium]
MIEVLAQIILAAREKKGWGNILFIVFLALFWAIGGILKATRAKKAEEEKAGGKLLSRKPEGKPAEGIKGLPKGPFQKIRLALEAELQKQHLLQAQQPQRKLARPQPAAQKVAAKTERAAQIPTLQPVEKAKIGPLTRQVQPKLQELPDFTGKTVKKLKDKRIDAPSEIPQVKHLAEILLDYSDPNELKRAILHYEILGKPLSLRESSGSIIGL